MESFCALEFFAPRAGELSEGGPPVAGYLGDAGQPVLRLRYDPAVRGRRRGRLERRPADALIPRDADRAMGPAIFLIHLWDAFEPPPEGSGGATLALERAGGEEGSREPEGAEPGAEDGPTEAVELWVREAPELAVPPGPTPDERVERLRLEFDEAGAAWCGLAIWRAEGLAAIIAGEPDALRGALDTFTRLLVWRPA